jgi:hypothetical protein
VGQIKQRGQSLDTVLAALHEARGSIFDAIFARSWDLLSATARQVLVVMPLFATSASREGIEAASDVHHFALDEALGQLVESLWWMLQMNWICHDDATAFTRWHGPLPRLNYSRSRKLALSNGYWHTIDSS